MKAKLESSSVATSQACDLESGYRFLTSMEEALLSQTASLCALIDFSASNASFPLARMELAKLQASINLSWLTSFRSPSLECLLLSTCTRNQRC